MVLRTWVFNPAHMPLPLSLLVEAPINADGTFSFTFPDASAMEPYLEATESWRACNARDTEFVEGRGRGSRSRRAHSRQASYTDVYAN